MLAIAAVDSPLPTHINQHQFLDLMCIVLSSQAHLIPEDSHRRTYGCVLFRSRAPSFLDILWGG